MKSKTAWPIPPLPAGAAAVLVAVICGIAFAAIMEWSPANPDEDGVGAVRSRLEQIATASVASQFPAPAVATASPEASGSCPRCGVIESVRTVANARHAPGIVSLGDGKDGGIMTVLVVVFNAMAGNPPGRAADPPPSYEIAVRFHDGSSRVLTENRPRGWKPGDPVKVINGRIEPHAG